MPGAFTTPRAILDSPAALLTGTAFLAAGWAVTTPVSRAALGEHRRELMHVPARLRFAFGDALDQNVFLDGPGTRGALPGCTSIVLRPTPPQGLGSATLAFATVADLAACLASPAGQALLATIADRASGATTAMILAGPAPSASTAQIPVEASSAGITAAESQRHSTSRRSPLP